VHDHQSTYLTKKIKKKFRQKTKKKKKKKKKKKNKQSLVHFQIFKKKEPGVIIQRIK
jgi:hypothetical protein